MTQKVMKPALAPKAVVAINSPDPTMAADKIKPGPKCFSLPRKVVGGANNWAITLNKILLFVGKRTVKAYNT